MELEKESILASTTAFNRTPPEHNIVLNKLNGLAFACFKEGIAHYLKKGRGGKASIKVYLQEILDEMPMKDVVYSVCKTILTQLSKASLDGGVTYTSLAFSLYDVLHYQAIFRRASKSPTFKKLMTKELRRGKDVAKKYLNNRPEATRKASRREQLLVGRLLIDLFASSTGIIKLYKKKSYGQRTRQTINMVEFTDTAIKWIDDMTEKASMLSPSFMPMVVPPNDWTTLDDGGYKYNLAAVRWKLFISRRSSPIWDIYKELKPDLSKVYSAVNAMQRTPFKVDKRIYEVMRHVFYKLGGDMAGLPPLQSRDYTELMKIPWEELTKEQKRERALIISETRREAGQRLSFMIKMSHADRFKDFDRIYFPYHLDSRGRAYPIPAPFNPQGDDVCKALLCFTEHKRLGASGLRWMKIGMANSYGLDKESLDKRVEWVNDNTPTILRIAENPLDTLSEWVDTDEPFQFLRACMDFSEAFKWAKETGRSMEDFESNYAVHMDGTCNGLQNFSALLLDDKGGKSVNLYDTGSREDIYGIIAKRVQEKISEVIMDATEKNELDKALLWQGKVTRSLVKTPVMTTPYGVTMRGIEDQLVTYLRDTKILHATDFPSGGSMRYMDVIRTMAQYIHDSIGETVSSAREAMDWLQGMAKKSGDKEFFYWQLPSGFIASQHYPKGESIRVRAWFGDSRIKSKFNQDLPDQMNKSKQVNAISPNVIHSLDSEHMRMTINRCLSRAVNNFWMIHDSYATLAADAEVMYTEIRKAFYELYKEDYGKRLLTDFATRYEYDKELPKMGDLDLEKVLTSPYFFS